MRERVRIVAVIALVAAAVATPVSGQTIEQITDYKVTVASPPTIDDTGSKIYSSVATNQLGTNPDFKFQVFEFDPATGTAVQITSFPEGVWPLQLDFQLSPVVDVSDDGMWLVFVAPTNALGTNHDESPELFAMRPNGTGLIQLTNDPGPSGASVSRLAFAGSGNRIVFVSTGDYLGSNPDNNPNLFVINRDGTGLAQLTSAPFSRMGGLTISDDGTRIAFSTDADIADNSGDGSLDNPDRSFEIFGIAWDGSGLVQLTDDAAFDSVLPDISGDGSKIAFESNANLENNNPQNQNEIFSIDWDGGALLQLTTSNSSGGVVPGAFSPSITDDASVVFMSSNHSQTGVNTDNNREVFKVNIDKSGLTNVTDTIFSDGCFFPAVSGDGSMVGFYSTHDFDGSNNVDQSPELFSADSDGSAVTQLTFGVVGSISALDMAANASKIVFVSDLDPLGGDADRGGEIYTINLDGTGLFQVTTSATGETRFPSVSDDGSKIAFMSDADYDGSNSDTNAELWIVNSDGTGLLRLSDTIGLSITNPRISSDGTVIVYDSTDNQSGLNGDNSREVFRINSDGTNLIQLSGGAGTEASRNPRIDGANNWTVFESDVVLDGSLSIQPGFIRIWRAVNRDNRPELLVDLAPFAARQPDVSFDSSKVVFASDADPLATNPQGNLELFLLDVPTLTISQLTFTSKGATQNPRFSNSGNYVYFQTSSEMFDDDPDVPWHYGRLHLATLAVERIGARDPGIFVTESGPSPSLDDSITALTLGGNVTLQNWDMQAEIFVVRHNVEAEEIEVSGGAPTTISWAFKSGPLRYDVVRGNVNELAAGAGTVDLGTVVCIEDDSPDVDTAGDEDVSDPASGEAYFYLWRGSEGSNAGPGSYGEGSGGDERVATSGDCTG